MSDPGSRDDHTAEGPHAGAAADTWAAGPPGGETRAGDTVAREDATDETVETVETAAHDTAEANPHDTAETDTAPAPAAESGADAGRPTRTRRRRAGYAALRAAVVLVAAGVGYQAVVPTPHVERTRLSKLVLTKTGVATYDKVKATASSQVDTGTQIAALTAAAKKDPNKTGLYLADWSVSDQVGAEMIGLLLPTEASATSALGQIKAQQMAAGSYTSDQLSRVSTFTVPGVPGATGAVYRPTAKTAGSPDVVVTAFRQGRMIGFTQLAGAGATAQRDAESMTTRQYAQFRGLGTGLDLSVIRRSTVVTILWAIGALLLAALAALVPVGRRWRADRRRRAYEEEMAHRVVVGSQVIAKYHRARPRT